MTKNSSLGRTIKKHFTFILGIMMAVALLGSAFILSTDNVYAAGSVYNVTGAEDGTFIAGVINGTQLDSGGQKYSGIKFPSGAKSYTLPSTLSPNRDFTIETAAGADVTVNHGFMFFSTTDTLTFKGSGVFTINGGTYGFYLNGANQKINIPSSTVRITNTSGFGSYFLGGGNTEGTINVNGGNFEVKNCSNGGNEGGLEFDSGQFLVSNGGQVLLENNGKTSFGDLYYNGTKPMLVTGAGSKVTINATTTASGYGMVLAGIGKMEIRDQAKVEINRDTLGNRGINAGGANNTITMTGSSELTVKGAGVASGIRRAGVIISDNSKLNVSGFIYALDGVTLNAGSKSHVTLNGTSMDDGSIPFLTGGTNQATITGGSVSMQPKESVINGLMKNTAADKVETTPINAAGEDLTRFDLASKANKTVSVAADPDNATGHPAYSYVIGNDHSGTAYVWAPAVKVNFWPTKADYDASTTANIIQTNYTIRGNKITDVQGTAPAAPAAPAGMVFSKWINAETEKEYVPTKDSLTKDIDVYPVYAVKPAAVYDVNYKFISGTSGKSLPTEVTKLLPKKVTGLADGTVVYPKALTTKTVKTADGTWTFTGWDKNSKTINSANVTFVGAWIFEKGGAGTNGANPKTGDWNNLPVWIIVGVAAGAVAIAAGLKKKKSAK